MAGRPSQESKEKAAKKYIKNNLLKQVGKQKLFELGIIPTGLLSIYYIPYWVGLLAVKLIGYDNYLTFINFMNAGAARAADRIVQDTLTRSDFYIIGFIASIIVAGFLIINVCVAISKLKNRAKKKFGVSYWDLSDFKIFGDYS